MVQEELMLCESLAIVIGVLTCNGRMMKANVKDLVLEQLLEYGPTIRIQNREASSSET
jgi:hypothetical protein